MTTTTATVWRHHSLRRGHTPTRHEAGYEWEEVADLVLRPVLRDGPEGPTPWRLDGVPARLTPAERVEVSRRLPSEGCGWEWEESLLLVRSDEE